MKLITHKYLYKSLILCGLRYASSQYKTRCYKLHLLDPWHSRQSNVMRCWQYTTWYYYHLQQALFPVWLCRYKGNHLLDLWVNVNLRPDNFFFFNLFSVLIFISHSTGVSTLLIVIFFLLIIIIKRLVESWRLSASSGN